MIKDIFAGEYLNSWIDESWNRICKIELFSSAILNLEKDAEEKAGEGLN